MKMGAIFRYSIATLTLILIFNIGIACHALPLNSYVYNSKENAVAIPSPYKISDIFEGDTSDIGKLKEPRDIFVSEVNNIYISDSGNNRILVLDSEFRLLKIISEYYTDVSGVRVKTKFNSPGGVFVSPKNELYVADTKNGRIVIFDDKGEFKKTVEKPDSEVIRKDFVYLPEKIAVDKADRLYVVGPGIVEGIVQFDSQGNFVNFIGSNKVKPNMLEYFWTRIFATAAQRDQSSLFLSEEYNSLDIDSMGFLYTASTLSGLKMMNTKGDDITKVIKGLEPIGDYKSVETVDKKKEVDSESQSISKFVDIVYDSHATYSAVDSSKKRVFTYDNEGNMLWAFGVEGYQKGAFKDPIAIDFLHESMLVLDRSLGRVNIFDLTEYGKQVRKGVLLRSMGDNEAAALAWSEVLKLNAGSQLAYTGLGKIQLSSKDYKNAMESFRLAGNRKYYSKAFTEHRRNVTKAIFPFVMTGIIILILFVLIYYYAVRKRRVASYADTDFYKDSSQLSLFRQLKYAKYVALHPFKAFWDIKVDKKVHTTSATVIFAVYILVNIIKKQATGFLFTTTSIPSADIFYELRTAALIILLWCTANWALTTLMDGEGTFKNIYIMTAFSIVPVIICNFAAVILSNFLNLQEGEIISVLQAFGLVYSAFLLFVGTIVTHQYTAKKNVFTLFLTFCAIAAMLFLGLIAIQMIDWVWNFVQTVFRELYLRV